MTNVTLFDYFVIGTLLLAIVIGWSRGIVEVVTSFLAFLVAAFLAGRFAPAAAQWVNKSWGMQDKIASSITNHLNLPQEAYRAPANGVTAEMLKGLPVPGVYKQALSQHVAQWAQNSGQTAAQAVAQQLAGTVLHAIVFLLLTAALTFVMLRLGRLISTVIKGVPLIGTANRLLGAAAIAVQGAVLLAFVVGMFGPTLALVGAKALGASINEAWSTPYLMQLYEWLSRVPFGRAGLYFLI